MKDRIRSFNNWLLVTLCFAVLLYFIYVPGFLGPFLLDDLQTLELAKLKKFSFNELLSISLQNDTGPIGRPLSVASFAVNHYFFGLSSYHYKLVNFIIHLLCTFNVGFFIFLISRLIPRVRAHAKTLGFLCALVWAIHPLQVSTVLYIVQRMSQLSALFTLLALNFYLAGRTKQLTQPSFAWVYIFISIIIFFPLAIASKENALLFPLYLLTIELFILRFHCAKPRASTLLKTLIYGLVALFIIGSLGYFISEYDFIAQVYREKDLTVIQRLLTEAKVLIFYCYLIVVPQVSKMSLWHDDFGIASVQDPFTWLSIVILSLLIGCIYLCRKKHPIISFGLSWFLISHLLEASILPLELVFEHRNYLASIGLILIPLFYLVSHAPKFVLANRILAYTALILILFLMSFLTFLRVQGWQSSNDLMVTAQIYQSQSPRVLIESANWYAANKGYETALKQLDNAYLIQPNNTGVLLHKIILFCLNNQPVPNDFYQKIEQSIQTNAITPYVLISLNTLVTSLMNQHCSQINSDNILEIINKALNNKFLKNRKKYHAVLHHLQAGLFLHHKQYDKTEIALLKSFEVFPKRIDPLLELAYLQIQRGNIAQAKKTIQLIEKNSRFPHYNDQKINHLKQVLHMEFHREIQD